MNLRTAIELTMSDGHEPGLDDIQQDILELSRALRTVEDVYGYAGRESRALFLLAHSPLADVETLANVLELTHTLTEWLDECFRDEHSASDRAEIHVFETAVECVRTSLHTDNVRALCTAVKEWNELAEGETETKYDECVTIAKLRAKHAVISIDTFLDRVRDKFAEELR